MNILESVSGFFGDAMQHLGSPMFSSVAAKAVVVAKTSVGTTTVPQNFTISAAKAALAFASVSCMLAGAALAVRSALKNCNIRGQSSLFKSHSLLPKALGENEKISGSANLANRVKSLFSKKMLPVAAGVATFTAGVFLLAHANYFVNAIKR